MQQLKLLSYKVNSQNIELLAPARDASVAKAAIDAGADAVYIGAPSFSARHAAANTIENIKETVDYAHLFNAKVLVALNTLLTDKEIPLAVSIIHQLYEADVDALIVQDYKLLEQDLPPIRLHASTQCDNRTVEQVQALEKAGFKRAVLARELSLEQIREIRQNTRQIELEAFVHGALCVSYSGRCYMSEVLAGRSANRGMCAQFCRHKYNLLDKEGKILKKDRHLLSLHDMDRSAYLLDLLEAGITTLKIEGRLKDKEYVTNITAYYRQMLDALFEQHTEYKRSSKGIHTYGFIPMPEKTFNRGGIDYFLNGRKPEMANFITPKSTGEYMGVITAQTTDSIIVEGSTNWHNGDGAVVGDTGFSINSQDIKGTRKVVLYPQNARNLPKLTGQTIARNKDLYFEKTLTAKRQLPIDIEISETSDGFSLKAIDTENRETLSQYTFQTEKQIAKQKDKATENLKTALKKTGDTVFAVREVNIQTTDTYFLPSSIINNARRELLKLIKNQNQTQKVDVHYVATEELQTHLLPDLTPQGETILMTCKYCLLNELGICRKKNKSDNEPVYIETSGHRMKLKFDCRKCEMLILDI